MTDKHNPNPTDSFFFRWRKELPAEYWFFDEISKSQNAPENPIQALMETLPLEEPQVSKIERYRLREIVNEAIDETLEPVELWVFNALFVEKKSLRTVGSELQIPKTTIARIRDRSTHKLRDVLSQHPLIQEYLER